MLHTTAHLLTKAKHEEQLSKLGLKLCGVYDLAVTLPHKPSLVKSISVTAAEASHRGAQRWRPELTKACCRLFERI